MSSSDAAEERLHRMRSTLARLRYEVELAESLSEGDRTNILSAINELLDLSGAVAEPGGAGRRMHVAVVDDDLRLAALISRSLERLGYTSHASQRVPESGLYDAWLVDWSVLRSGTAASPPPDRLILMSGTAIDVSATGLPDCPFLLKPFVVSKLDAVLRGLDAARST